MCLAAAIAGIGFDQVGLVLTHAMAHPLSGRFGVPHGVACALLTPPVMAFNAIAAPERLAEVGHILGVPRDRPRRSMNRPIRRWRRSAR